MSVYLPARQLNTVTQMRQKLMWSADTSRCAQRPGCDCCRVLALCTKLWPGNIPADHRLYASGYQMLDQVVHYGRDHHARIRGGHERGRGLPCPVVIHVQSIHACDTFSF